MSKLPPLLCRSPLQPGESLPSLLIRLAKVNRYEPPTLLDQLYLAGSPDTRPGEPTHPTTFQRLAELTQIEPTQLYQATAYYFAQTLTPLGLALPLMPWLNGQVVARPPRHVLQKYLHPFSTVQFCPHCLRESAYHRLMWLPRAVAVCLRHRCLLLQGCPTCQQDIPLRDLVQTRCHRCAADLTQAPTLDLSHDTWGLLTQYLVQTWLMPAVRPESPPDLTALGLPDQPPPVLYQLLAGLQASLRTLNAGWSYLHQLASTAPTCSNPPFPGHRATQCYLGYATAAKALIHWPAGFYDFLQAYRVRPHRSLKQGLWADFGSLYTQCLQKNWHYPAFQFVQDAFDHFLVVHYARSYALVCSSRYRKNPALAAQFAYLSVAEAAHLLETSPSGIHIWLHTGRLTSYPSQDYPDAHSFVSRAEILALRRQHLLISLTEAAQQLGLPPQVVMDMANLGLLEAQYHPPSSQNGSWLFSKSSIQNCHRRLANEVYCPPNSVVDLSTAAAMLAAVGLNEAAIFKRMLAGQLSAYCHELYPYALSELLFAQADIEAWVNQMKTELQRSGHVSTSVSPV